MNECMQASKYIKVFSQLRFTPKITLKAMGYIAFRWSRRLAPQVIGAKKSNIIRGKKKF